MRELLKPVLSLFIICFVVALCLSVVNFYTRDVITQRTIQDAATVRKQVLPAADLFTKKKDWIPKDASSSIIREVYLGTASGKPVGLVYTAWSKGYAGEIKVLIGISLDGLITGVQVIEQKETPGLGAKTKEAVFVNQYQNKKIDMKWLVVKKKPVSEQEIQAISGATISSKAVTLAVQIVSEQSKIILQGKVEP